MSDPRTDRKSERSFTAFFFGSDVTRIRTSGSANQGLQAETVSFSFHILFLMKGFNHRFHLEERRRCDYQPSVSEHVPAQSCPGVGCEHFESPRLASLSLDLTREVTGATFGESPVK